jgi:hypothetical protein
MENLKDMLRSNINEAREIEYRVQFVGFQETVSILVPREFAREFDNFLDNEQDNIFAHAEGSSIEY